MILNISGLDEAEQTLATLIRELAGKEIPITDVLTQDFISRTTKFSTLEELFEVGGFRIESRDDFVSISVDQLDQFIALNSSCRSWSELLSMAWDEWIKNKLK